MWRSDVHRAGCGCQRRELARCLKREYDACLERTSGPAATRCSSIRACPWVDPRVALALPRPQEGFERAVAAGRLRLAACDRTRACRARSGLAVHADATRPRLRRRGSGSAACVGQPRDNACNWARHEVRVSATTAAVAGEKRWQIVIDDDGPGIGADRRDTVMARAAGSNESVPGSGFGLGLELVRRRMGLQVGSVQLHAAPAGGLRVVQDSGCLKALRRVSRPTAFPRRQEASA